MDEHLRQWGQNIKTGRMTLRWSQARLAGEVGVTQQTVASWEAGKQEPRRHHKVRLATALRQDVKQLFPLMRSAA